MRFQATAGWLLGLIVATHAGGGGERILFCRGGSSLDLESALKVTVLTAVGSPHVDLKSRFEISPSASVGELKKLVEEKMAGRPPPFAQRLVFGSRWNPPLVAWLLLFATSTAQVPPHLEVVRKDVTDHLLFGLWCWVVGYWMTTRQLSKASSNQSPGKTMNSTTMARR